MERPWAERAVELAGALLAATAVSDAFGSAGVSFYLLVVAVPVTAVAGLVCLGSAADAVEKGAAAVRGRLQIILLVLLLAAIVLGAAAREPAIEEGSVPLAATIALGLGLAFLAAQAVLALAPFRR